jgi:hypothetical protein
MCAGSLDLAHVIDVRSLILAASKESSVWTIAGLMIAAYLIGIIVDAVGMAFDELVDHIALLKRVLRYDIGKLPELFYAKSQKHQLAYWIEQWTFFSCYRNLLMLAPAWVTIAIAIAYKYGGCPWAWTIVVMCAVTTASLLVTMRPMQGVLANISKVAP